MDDVDVRDSISAFPYFGDDPANPKRGESPTTDQLSPSTQGAGGLFTDGKINGNFTMNTEMHYVAGMQLLDEFVENR